MKRSTPIPPERSRQVAMAFDSHKMLGMSPRQREAVLMALATLITLVALVLVERRAPELELKLERGRSIERSLEQSIGIGRERDRGMSR